MKHDWHEIFSNFLVTPTGPLAAHSFVYSPMTMITIFFVMTTASFIPAYYPSFLLSKVDSLACSLQCRAVTLDLACQVAVLYAPLYGMGAWTQQALTYAFFITTVTVQQAFLSGLSMLIILNLVVPAMPHAREFDSIEYAYFNAGVWTTTVCRIFLIKSRCANERALFKHARVIERLEAQLKSAIES